MTENIYGGSFLRYGYQSCAWHVPDLPKIPKLPGPPMRVKKGEVYDNDGDRSEVVRVGKNTVIWRKLGGVEHIQSSYPSDFSDWVRHPETKMVRNRHRYLEKKR